MEYRRKRKPNRRKSISGRSGAFRSGAKQSSETARTFLSLLMVGGIVYFVSASAAGTWIAENMIAPMISAVSQKHGDGEDSQASDTQSLSAAVDLTANSNANAISAEVSLPALDCYMLQMGVYSSEENAKAQADLLKAQGAGGYIIPDTASGELRYRVMASGYDNAESAKSVKTRLTEEGVDCTVHTLSAAGAAFRVTADETHLAGIESGFGALKAAESALGDAAIRFDKEALPVEEGMLLASSILSSLDADMASLLSLDASDPALSGLLSAYRDTKAALQTLTEGAYENRIAFSSQLKYTHLYSAHRYAQLISSLA
ncbi:MAG: SPOR domain-containing protein [Clostridia bacterium]|nr:SPOR domain-containing protein [Clostridia bacterium]